MKRADFDGVLGEARCVQRSARFRLPVEAGLGGIDCVRLGRKCISSVSIASCRFSLVTPKMRPATKIWVCGVNEGKFAQRCPFLKYMVIGKVCSVRVELL